MSIARDADATTRIGLQRLFWRVHFWAGLVTAPLVVFAACTGLLYVFTPQIEAWQHAALDRVPVSGPPLALDAQVAAARATMSGATPRSIVPAHAPGDTLQVLFAASEPAHAGHGEGAAHDPGLPQGRIVYVDPTTAQVVGSVEEMQRFKTWAKKLHSSALQGDAWRWPLELAASWMLVMFATGLSMAWPRSRARGGPGWRGLVPRLGRGRATWRDLHAAVGVLMCGLLAVVLVTGLTWSRHAGDHFRAAQQALGQASPKPPRDLRSQPSDGQARLGVQTVYETAKAALPGVPLQLTPPKGDDGYWRIESLARERPTQRALLALDAFSGRVLYRSGWDDLPPLAKATALGIPFHRAEFGVWNQGLLALAALGAIFSVVSGVVMWWHRRPARSIGAPALRARTLRAVPGWLWVLTAALAWALPVFGLSLAAVVSLELVAAAWRRRALPASAA